MKPSVLKSCVLSISVLMTATMVHAQSDANSHEKGHQKSHQKSQAPTSQTAASPVPTDLVASQASDSDANSSDPKTASTVEYYRHLVFRESPVENIRGSNPLTEKDRHQNLHFKFVRDSLGRITEVSQMLGDHVVSSNGSWEGFFWFAPTLKISYQPNKEIRTFYNLVGEQVAAHGQVYQAEFSLDAAGQRQTLQFFDQAGQPVNSEWGITKYQWQHTKPGTVTEQRFNLAGTSMPMRPNLLFHQVRLEFGNDDLLDFVYHIDGQGNLVNNPTGAAVDRIVYDFNDNFIRWQVYNQQLQPVNGNAPQVAIGEHLYDERGNKIALRGFSTDGADKALAGTEGLTTNQYDRFGNLEKIREFNAEKQLIAEIQFSYSADGRRREWTHFYDGKGQLAGNQGPAAVQYLYNPEGKHVGQKLFDAKMQEINMQHKKEPSA
ncbi:MAG: hypothetical protein KKB00_10460 [Gammaproteobacteria bacterium]|nr:hypothetical protein [Gammaproteobacteria bacterium]